MISVIDFSCSKIRSKTFEDYKSKYLDLHDQVKQRKEKDKVSILEDVDFELSLIHRDEINVAYILGLLVALKTLKPEEAKKRQREILDLLAGEVNLRSKRDLITSFIEENLPKLKPGENVTSAFERYWSEHQKAAFGALCEEEQLHPTELERLLDTYAFANRLPREQEIVSALTFKPKILERKGVIQRIKEKIQAFIDTFIEGMGGI